MQPRKASESGRVERRGSWRQRSPVFSQSRISYQSRCAMPHFGERPVCVSALLPLLRVVCRVRKASTLDGSLVLGAQASTFEPQRMYDRKILHTRACLQLPLKLYRCCRFIEVETLRRPHFYIGKHKCSCDNSSEDGYHSYVFIASSQDATLTEYNAVRKYASRAVLTAPAYRSHLRSNRFES